MRGEGIAAEQLLNAAKRSQEKETETHEDWNGIGEAARPSTCPGILSSATSISEYRQVNTIVHRLLPPTDLL
ncbi:hypothetical protein ACWCW7_19060, partial [Nocardia tengchongensis]